MPNYKDCKIFSIRSKTNPEHIYVGFTTLSLDKCWSYHKSLYNAKCPVQFYKVITDINDWYIQLEGYHPCNNKIEASIIKQTYIDKLSTLNYKLNDEFSKNLYNY